MSTQISGANIIRSATTGDEAAILQLLTRFRGKAGSNALVLDHSAYRAERLVRTKALDGCLLLAEKRGKLTGLAGIDLDRQALSALLVSTAHNQSTLADALLDRAEALALAFGVLDLRVTGPAANFPWFLSRAYGPERTAMRAMPRQDGKALPVLSHSLRRRQSRYSRLVGKMAEELGIPQNYGQFHRLQLQQEARKLESIGLDVFGREQWMTPDAAKAWLLMREAALARGIELQTVSAWRSVDYQRGLLQRKLAKGLSIEAILQVSAAPGYSEHHTGRAIDITTPGCPALSEAFAESPAYAWLRRNAGLFGFCLSFPRRNRHRLAFEPWHWCISG